MTVQIRKSLLSSTDMFDIEVAAFAHELRNWRAHMARVDEDRRNGVQGIARHDPHPAPTAHPLIAAAVNDETAEPDYEFVDDPLDERKARLTDLVSKAANEATNRIALAPKFRLAQLRTADILRDDADRMSKVMERHNGLLQKLKIKSIDQGAVDAEVASLRPAQDSAILAEVDEKQGEIAAIQRTMIESMAAIEDLSSETIDTYQLPKF